MKKLLSIFILGLFLQGCGVGGAYFTTDKERYRDWPTSQLCIAYYASLVKSGIHTSTQRQMIEERGLDCSPYKEEGIMKGEADLASTERMKKNLDHLGSSSNSNSVKSKPVNCTTRKVGGYVPTFCY